MKIMLYDSGLGVIPFLKVILKEKLNNDFYFYIDSINFPYGDKDDKTLKNILAQFLDYVLNLKIDYLLICCNTMSRIFLENNYNLPFKVKTILEINLHHLDSSNYLLGTSSLKSKYQKSVIDGEFLASYIENNCLLNIILYLKKLSKENKKIILSCTHYYLLKNILPFYKINFLSYEKEIFKDIPICNELNIYIKKKNYDKFKNYYKLGIKFY